MENNKIIFALIIRESSLILAEEGKLFVLKSIEFKRILEKIKKSIEANSMGSISRHLRSAAILIFQQDSNRVENFIWRIKVIIFPVFFREEIEFAREDIVSKIGKEPCSIGRLQKISKSFYSLCKNNLPREGEKLDVELISNILGLRIIRQSSRTIEEVFDKITQKLQELNPEVANFDCLFDNGCRNELYFLNKESEAGRFNWDDFSDYLPEKWKVRWRGRKYKNTFYTNIKKLRIFLEENNPQYFNVRYIYLHRGDIWHYFYDNCKNIHTGKTDWSKIIKHLPLRWQKIWRSGECTKKSQHPVYFFETAIDRLQSILKRYNPVSFSVSFIKSQDEVLYFYFVKRVRDDDGYIDWRMIISCLDEKWQKLFVFPNNLHFHLPRNFYENPGELERLIKRENFSLYLFFAPSNPENRLECDKISRAIVTLIKRGNLSAYNLFMEYLEQITAFWVQNNDQLSSLVHSREDVNEVLRRCIFLFQPKKKNTFLSYTFSALTSKAFVRRREGGQDLRLDDQNHLGISYHEIIAQEEDYF